MFHIEYVTLMCFGVVKQHRVVKQHGVVYETELTIMLTDSSTLLPTQVTQRGLSFPVLSSTSNTH